MGWIIWIYLDQISYDIGMEFLRIIQPLGSRDVKFTYIYHKIQVNVNVALLSQWLTGFKLLGIPYLVGKIKFNVFCQGPLAK